MHIYEIYKNFGRIDPPNIQHLYHQAETVYPNTNVSHVNVIRAGSEDNVQTVLFLNTNSTSDEEANQYWISYHKTKGELIFKYASDNLRVKDTVDILITAAEVIGKIPPHEWQSVPAA